MFVHQLAFSQQLYRGVSLNVCYQDPASTQSLDGEWKLRIDPNNIGLALNWEKSPLTSDFVMKIPGSIQTLDTLSRQYPLMNGLRNSYLGTFWLERSFHPGNWDNEQVIWLKTVGILPAAHVWSNGQYLDYHQYGVQ